MHIIDVQSVVERTTVNAHTTARTGTQLKFSVSCHLHTVAESQFAEVDEEHFGEDVHVAGEGHHEEEDTKGDGV